MGPRPQKNRQKIARNSPTESDSSAMGQRLKKLGPMFEAPDGNEVFFDFLGGSSAHRRIVQWDFLRTNHTPNKKTSPQVSVAAAMFATTTAAVAAAARFCGRSDHGTLSSVGVLVGLGTLVSLSGSAVESFAKILREKSLRNSRASALRCPCPPRGPQIPENSSRSKLGPKVGFGGVRESRSKVGQKYTNFDLLLTYFHGPPPPRSLLSDRTYF